MKHNELEIEVKFFLNYPTQFLAKLLNTGARPFPRRHELNICYDTLDRSIQRNGGLLRLRKNANCTLTHKSKPANTDAEVKIFRELEVVVNDFDTMDAILNGLGYRPFCTYEKWRQIFEYKNVILFLDNLPFGDFLEIEGDKSSIREIAGLLGLPWHKRILTNYLSIFERLKSKTGLPFSDPTFENFKNHPVGIAPYVQEFEAGL